VNNDNLNLVEQIGDALHRIEHLFRQQCAYGAQTKALPEVFASCGQFIGDDASEIPQRGLHGISAALRVLGPCKSPESIAIVARLVKYCEANFENDLKSLPDERQRLEPDDMANVIKLGELLHGLSFLSAAHADTGRLAHNVASLLQRSLVDGKGWGYFLGDDKPALLPTAYAVRGLESTGFEQPASRTFISDTLARRAVSSSKSAADLTTAVACAYCLTFSTNGKQDNVLKAAFHSAWRSLEPLLTEDFEQNLEYWRGSRTYYVRVPWQLYLMALASEYSFYRFTSFRCQTKLRSAIRAVRSASFKYPYSGQYLSSRTNAVAFEVLGAIRDRVRRLLLLHVAYAVDCLRVFSGSRPVRIAGFVLALVIIVYSSWQWYATGSARASDLAPKFLAALVIGVLAWGRR